MINRKKALAALLLLVATGATVTGLYIEQADHTSDSNLHIVTTGSAQNPSKYGLLPKWQYIYNGSYRDEWLSDKPPAEIKYQCGACHASGGDDYKADQVDTYFTGFSARDAIHNHSFFLDNNSHRGPNTQLLDETDLTIFNNQDTCGECHTMAGSAVTSGTLPGTIDDYTNDPHAVHNGASEREGCLRCHSFANVTFASGQTYEFIQGNATANSYGLANPINMTRASDGFYLSTDLEASYSYNASNGGLNSSGTGWAKYAEATDTANVTQFGCSDCHALFHTFVRRAGPGGNLSYIFDFTFNESSRKGPLTVVNSTIGINVSGVPGNTSISGGTISGGKACVDCHVTTISMNGRTGGDPHAVHTDGSIWTNGSFDAQAGPPKSPASEGYGAETCDECHGINIVPPLDTAGGHVDYSSELGLGGDPEDRLPNDDGGDNDCGFCHA